jgi:hypothetical protein
MLDIQKQIPEIEANPSQQQDIRVGVGTAALLGAAESAFSTHDDRDIISMPEQSEWLGGYEKLVPKFSEQRDDLSRTSPITYVAGTRTPMGTVAGSKYSLVDHNGKERHRKQETLTEHQSLMGLSDFLEKVSSMPPESDGLAAKAESMLKDLTFIGERERKEAVAGIANGWRRHLNENSSAQLCAVWDMAEPGGAKSGRYLLDSILKEFTDQELTQWSDRLVTVPENLTADPSDVSVVVLDDWTISGQQLAEEVAIFSKEYPEYKDSIGIQLIASTEERLRDGLGVHIEDMQEGTVTDRRVPVNAYYLAHGVSRELAPASGAHITGAHCSVDYDFEEEIADMAELYDMDMPPATNIFRPYRQKGVILDQMNRLLQEPAPDAIAQARARNEKFVMKVNQDLDGNPIDKRAQGIVNLIIKDPIPKRDPTTDPDYYL